MPRFYRGVRLDSRESDFQSEPVPKFGHHARVECPAFISSRRPFIVLLAAAFDDGGYGAVVDSGDLLVVVVVAVALEDSRDLARFL